MFKGKDGSLGYKDGMVYELIVNQFTVTRVDGSGICKYSSIQSFLSNWEFCTEVK